MAGRGPVALLGAGVIGGGWAARFLLNGIDVSVFDPDPGAPAQVARTLENARRALRRLTLAPLPEEGRLAFAASVAEAVDGATFVQESGPEREPLKRELLAEASRSAPASVAIASSTSGLLPSRLQSDMADPERLCIGHPFNPVYLLPLVEVCGGDRTASGALEEASAVYRSIGMRPLVLSREIDGFVADRLLEALWREALWLVEDDVATVEEIDDAIRFGAGLRWAAMGTFLTYRIAGGEAGMRHFLAQFGPALRWPWSRLTDVPDLTDELIDKIVSQSDVQAGDRSLPELERLRDDCLVSVLQGLRTHEFGAGAVLADYERALFGAAPPEPVTDLSRPLRLHEARVLPEWVDYNGHTHESRYLQVFGDTADALFRLVGIDAAYLESVGSYFTVETHLSLLRESHADQRLHATVQLLGFDDKRLHTFASLYRSDDDELLATAEQMYVHVEAAGGRAGPAAAQVLRRVEEIAVAHAALTRPERAGRSVGLRS